tara:strand:- start:303 stop:542 length:240 start_codon:yes stop_codon:yes gene_type:complete
MYNFIIDRVKRFNYKQGMKQTKRIVRMLDGQPNLLAAKHIPDPIVQAGVKLIQNPDAYMDNPYTEQVLCAAKERLKTIA